MGPTPVGVEGDGAGLGGAASATSASASLPRQLGVSFGGDCASLLSAGGSVERERSESERPVHGCGVWEGPMRDAGKQFDGSGDMLYTILVATVDSPFGTSSMYRDDQNVLRGASIRHARDGQERCHQSREMYGLSDHPYVLAVPE